MLNMNNEEALAVIFANSYDALIPEMVSERLMASIPFAGRYRLCDFLISSMVHSGIDNISLIVKKNYHSLMDHPVSYTHLRAHETGRNLVCRLLLEKKKKTK